MPLYLSRFSYTPETWARLIANPEDRRSAAESYIESVGSRGPGLSARRQVSWQTRRAARIRSASTRPF